LDGITAGPLIHQLCGIDDDGEGQYNAEGITAIADAMRMRVDGALTEIK
jgi:hypothetical protein